MLTSGSAGSAVWRVRRSGKIEPREVWAAGKVREGLASRPGCPFPPLSAAVLPRGCPASGWAWKTHPRGFVQPCSQLGGRGGCSRGTRQTQICPVVRQEGRKVASGFRGTPHLLAICQLLGCLSSSQIWLQPPGGAHAVAGAPGMPRPALPNTVTRGFLHLISGVLARLRTRLQLTS